MMMKGKAKSLLNWSGGLTQTMHHKQIKRLWKSSQRIAKENRVITKQVFRKIRDTRKDASAVGTGNQRTPGLFDQNDGVHYAS